MRRGLPVIAVAFCAGALLRLMVHVGDGLAVGAVALSLAALLAFGTRAWAGPVAAVCLAATLGLFRAGVWTRLPADSVAHLADRRWVRLHGRVSDDPAVRPWGASFTMDAERAETRREPLRVSGRVRVWLAPDVPAPRYGDTLAVEGRISLPDDAANPGEIPPAQYLRRDGIVAVLPARSMRVEGHDGGSVTALALRCKHALARGITATLPPDRAALLCGLLFSDTGALPDGVQQAFARSGTVHILSTSGLHVSLLAFMLALVFPARKPSARRWRSAALLAALLFFALMTGLRPAVMRAVLMTGAVLAAPLFDREPDTWCALAMAVLVLVALSPGNLLDPGFQLSFAAALALSLWFAAERRLAVTRWVRAWRKAGSVVQTSVVASAATVPLAAQYFGTLSLASPLTNLLVVPAVAPAMALGLVQGAAWHVWPALAMAAGTANRFVLDWILNVTSAIGEARWSAVETGPLPALTIAAFYAGLAGLLAVRLMDRAPHPGRTAPDARVRVALAATAAVCLIAALSALISPRPRLRVTFLDVGQGDATLIQTPCGRAVLIDAGGRQDAREGHPNDGTVQLTALYPSDEGERIVVPALRRAGVTRLDAVILTHPHEDHAGGLPAVLKAVPVGLWLDGGQPHNAPGYEASLALARSQSIPHRLARAGQRLDLEPGVTLDILSPAPPRLAGTRDDVNNNSIVCRLRYGRAFFLFCGDAESEEEARLLESGMSLRADVLKVGHHGGATSATVPFLAAVHPRIAVISCGRRNRYGHPAEKTLERFQAADVCVYQTPVDGGISAESDGTTVQMRASRWTLP